MCRERRGEARSQRGSPRPAPPRGCLAALSSPHHLAAATRSPCHPGPHGPPSRRAPPLIIQFVSIVQRPTDGEATFPRIVPFDPHRNSEGPSMATPRDWLKVTQLVSGNSKTGIHAYLFQDQSLSQTHSFSFLEFKV